MPCSSISVGLEVMELSTSSVESTNLNHCMCGSIPMMACETFSAEVIYKKKQKENIKHMKYITLQSPSNDMNDFESIYYGKE